MSPRRRLTIDLDTAVDDAQTIHTAVLSEPVDERDGMTRGYIFVAELGITDGEPQTRVVKSIGEQMFKQMVLDALPYGK